MGHAGGVASRSLSWNLVLTGILFAAGTVYAVVVLILAPSWTHFAASVVLAAIAVWMLYMARPARDVEDRLENRRWERREGGPGA